MNWDKLFTKQYQLDQYIIQNHQLENEDLFEERFLALLVELGELANETRCFKYWSEKAPSPNSVILEEYVDNIHFLLSLGLEKGFQYSEIDTPIVVDDVTATEQFNHVFQKGLAFYTKPTELAYIALFQAYLQLASILGFSVADIFEAYDEKNEVNYERQDQGY